jgi:hypothetical protein
MDRLYAANKDIEQELASLERRLDRIALNEEIPLAERERLVDELIEQDLAAIEQDVSVLCGIAFDRVVARTNAWVCRER